jgi:hypothetical protein
MAEPFERPPLTHFLDRHAEAVRSTVPQSLNEQEDGLVSRETADPCEILVLVSTPLQGPKPAATGRPPGTGA